MAHSAASASSSLRAAPASRSTPSARFVGNRSSGRMGVAIAAEAHRRGAVVTLLAANLAVPAPAGVEVRGDAHRGRPRAGGPRARRPTSWGWPRLSPITGRRRPSRRSGRRTLWAWFFELEPTADVLSALDARRREGQLFVGFAAETGADGLGRAREKLLQQGRRPHRPQRCGADRHRIRRRGERGDARDGSTTERTIAKAPKDEIAGAILDEVEARGPLAERRRRAEPFGLPDPGR